MKMLVLLDGSKFSEAVIPSAAAMASAGGFEVTLARVLRMSEFRAPEVPPGPEDYRDRFDITGRQVVAPRPSRQALAEAELLTEERLREEVELYLTGMAHAEFPRGAGVAVLVGDDVTDAIVNHAREQAVDVIAMATHGRSGFVGALMGSVATAILRSGVAPVLMVRPREA